MSNLSVTAVVFAGDTLHVVIYPKLTVLKCFSPMDTAVIPLNKNCPFASVIVIIRMEVAIQLIPPFLFLQTNVLFTNSHPAWPSCKQTIHHLFGAK